MTMEEVEEEAELDGLLHQINCLVEVIVLEEVLELSPGVTDTYPLLWLAVLHRLLLLTQILVNEAVRVSNHSLRTDCSRNVMLLCLVAEFPLEYNGFFYFVRRLKADRAEGV